MAKRRQPTLIVKSEDQHLIYGEVYAPDRPDAQGEYMTRIEIQKMAHEFLRSAKCNQIDVLHDNKVVKGCAVVESFLAADNDPTFIPGAWVIGMHVPDDGLWNRVKKGEINGFSMEALVTRHTKDVEVEIPPVVTGTTSKSEGHEHTFYVTYDEKGQFKGGVTDLVNGHRHVIIAGTHTQPVNGHSHRFSSVDTVRVVG